MESIANIFKQQRGRINFDHLATLHRLRKLWPDLVGTRFAKLTFPKAYDGKQLTITVGNSSIMSEWSYLQDTLQAQLLNHLKLKELQIRTTLGSLP